MYDNGVTFPCNELSLEGVLSLPKGSGPFHAVVLCHPHPLFGGTMDNDIILAVAEALDHQHIATLRFNFRGVGMSEGTFADGIGEREDTKAAISFLSKEEKIDPNRIGLCGYSFGTVVGFPVAAEDNRIKAIAGISPFISPPDLFSGCAKPKFLIWGNRDTYIDLEKLERIKDDLPDPKHCEVVPRVDHFWWGYEMEVGSKVAVFFATALKAKA